MSRHLICSLVISLLITTSCFAATIEREFDFNPLEIVVDGEYHQVIISGLITNNSPGYPQLPYLPYNLITPPGEILVDIEVINEEWVSSGENIIPKPGSAIRPISQDVTEDFEVLSDVYTSHQVYPAKLIDRINTDFYSGHGIGRFTIHPVRWNPVTKELEQLVHLTLSIHTAPDTKAEKALELLRSDKKIRNDIHSMTTENDYLSQYVSSGLDDLDEIDTKMLIVCDSDFQEIWQTFVDFKNRFGLKTEMLTTDEINSNYNGIDLQEKIRNAIIDYYGTGLEYVILGGDVEYVPCRELYSLGTVEYEDYIPADLYYAGLDGNWNNDGDEMWGEPGEDDPYQEICVGRASVSSIEDAENWINKQISFQSEPVDNGLNEALMVGEYLRWMVCGADYKEEIRLGSDHYGYTTAGFPDDWTVNTLYDRDGGWSDEELLYNLNNGVQLINHMGHCGVSFTMRLDTTQILNENLTNNGINQNFYFLYTQGCYCGSFDDTCVVERMNNLQNGPFGIVSNSRYGWGNLSNTDGPSHYYDREFFDAIFGENIYTIGEVFRDSKHDNIAIIDNECMRFCFYELNLFGDPSIEFYTETLQHLEVTTPSAFFISNDNLYVTSEGDRPFHVAVSRDNELYGIAESDESGVAAVPLSDITEGDLDIVVTSHNCRPIEVTIPALSTEDVYPVFHDLFIEDSQNPNTANEQADFGESCYLGLVIKNVGSNTLSDLNVQIEDGSQFVVVDNTQHQTSSIEPDGLDTLYLETNIDLHVPDNHPVPLQITMSLGEESWVQNAEFFAHAPVIECSVVELNDENSGDSDHRLDPGENASFKLHIKNTGSSDLLNSHLTLITDSDGYTITENESCYLNLLAETERTEQLPFVLEIPNTHQDPSKIFFTVNLALDETDYSIKTSTYLDVGGIYNDFETGNEWQHYSLNDQADQWHLESSRNMTFDGEYSYKAGGSDLGSYADNSDYVLQLPYFESDEAVRLSFYHRMDAEISPDAEYYFLDGGWIEVSPNGNNWVRLAMPGYNFKSDGNSPVEIDSTIYSGSFDWTYESIVLRYEQNTGYIRFRFYSNDSNHLEGWYVDNISISKADWGYVAPSNLEGQLEDQSLNISWSMPDFLPYKNFPSTYSVLRNNQVITSDLTETVFVDDISGLPNGTYEYTIIAAYMYGQSDPSNPYTLYLGVSGTEEEDVLPSDWEIYPPYPNPFNPSFSVKIDLAENAQIEACLYNVLGKRVKMVSTGMVAAGNHTIQFNDNQLSSGIYFLSVKAGPATKTFKVVMLK